MDLQPGCIPMVRMGDDNTFVVGQFRLGTEYSSSSIIPSIHAQEEQKVNRLKESNGFESGDCWYDPPDLIYTQQYTVVELEEAINRNSYAEMATIFSILKSALAGRQVGQANADQTRYTKERPTWIADANNYGRLIKDPKYPFVYGIYRSDKARATTAQSIDLVDILIGAMFYKGGGV
ncbi:MAG: hypothetical protein KKC24_11265 [Gammaproteobacteria bacterium]|nr:hypothetical protein [Gammaproteobacteria bacterium]MBU0819419.1 hypothetical protein [Gammaproteobacteria bacterium]MBU0843349.1 hypothetical protein [Gammaproteobacteria bacterium]MBU1838586.1 hypothetical protein [Gammaproteobacteria bacterium]